MRWGWGTTSKTGGNEKGVNEAAGSPIFKNAWEKGPTELFGTNFLIFPVKQLNVSTLPRSFN